MCVSGLNIYSLRYICTLIVVCLFVHHNSQPITSHNKQETRCRDPIFAFLLYGNIAAIIAVAGIYGTQAFSDSISDTTSGYNYLGYVYATFILGAVAIVLSGISLPIMMCMPMALIKCSLIGSVILSGVSMVLMFVWGNILGGIFSVSLYDVGM